MTTSTATPRVQYTASGSQTNFTFNFSIADINSLDVYVGTTLKTYTTDYTITFDSGSSGTGTVVFNSAPAASSAVYLIRNTYNVRSTDFEQGGAFLASTINNELDRLTQGIQDIDNILTDKVFRLAEPTTETATLIIPAAATRANKTLTFDGSGNVTVTTAGTGTVSSVGLTTSDANITIGSSPVTTSGSITINLANPLVKNLTGNVTGNADTATYASAVTLTADNSTNATNYPLFASAATGNLSPRTDTSLTYNPSTNTLTAGTFSGNLTGDVTGTVSGNAGSATYASAVTLTADNTTNATNYPLFTNAATGNLSPRTDTGFTYNPSTGVLTTTSVTGDLTGNASSATYASAVTLTADNSTNATNFPLFTNASTGNLSPRTDTGFTYNPSTGILTSTAFAGNLTGAVTGNADTATYASAVTLTADNSTNATNYPLFVNAATGNLSPRTDTGFTYNPSTGVLTTTSVNGNLTGNVTGNVTGNADTATYSSAVTLTADNSTNATNYILFTNAATGNLSPRTDTALSYNPSSDTLTVGNVSSTGTGTFNNLTVNGNLVVEGTTTTLNTATLDVEDNIITLNSNTSGSATADAGIEIERGTDTNVSLIWNETTDKWTIGSQTFVAATVEANVTGNLTGNVDTGGLTINDNNITATQSNDDINLITSGTGNINVDSAKIINVADPSSAQHAATKNYVDTQGFLKNTVEDTTPQLGGDLDVNSFGIVSTANGNIALTPDGTGDIHLNSDSIRIGDNNNHATLVTRGTGDLVLTTNEGSAVEGIVRINHGANGNITLTPNGTGSVVLDGLNWPQSDGSANYVLKTNGSGQLSWVAQTVDTNTTYSISAETVSGGANLRLTDSAAVTDDVKIESGTGITVSRTDANTITVATSATYLTDIVNDTTPQLGGSLDVNGQIITSTSNGNIELQPNGTGDVYLTADTIRVGDSNTDATITTNGTGDLILNTNSGTNSGTITIADGANGNITILPNGTGLNILGDDYTLANTDNYDNITNNFPDVGEIANFKGNLLFYSNLAVANKTVFADRDFINNRVAYGKAESGITFNDNDFRFRTSDITHFDMNGATCDSNVTNALSANVGANHTTVQIANTGGGTKTTPNMVAMQGFNDLLSGHTGDLTAVNVVGFRSSGTIRANTGEFSRITNAYGIRADSWGTGGTGANGTNRFITNEFAFYDHPTSQSSLVTNHYGLYINSGSAATNKYGVYVADSSYINTLGGVTLQNGAISTGDSTALQIDDGMNVNGTLTANTFVTNEISSSESSAIQINDGVNISGATTFNGTLRINGQYTEKQNSLTSSSTITVDCTLAPVHKVTLGVSTGFVISNLPAGGTVTIIIVQDATGSRTATFGTDGSTAVKFAGGTPTLSTAANSIDVVTIYNDGTNYLGNIAKAFA